MMPDVDEHVESADLGGDPLGRRGDGFVGGDVDLDEADVGTVGAELVGCCLHELCVSCPEQHCPAEGGELSGGLATETLVGAGDEDGGGRRGGEDVGRLCCHGSIVRPVRRGAQGACYMGSAVPVSSVAATGTLVAWIEPAWQMPSSGRVRACLRATSVSLPD